MRPKIYEFLVKATVSGEADIKVIGRCGDVPIRIGDEFEVICDYKPYKFPDESGRPPIRSRERPVSLRVTCIHAYQHSLPELGEGMTGSLALEGVGADAVIPGWVLGRKDGEMSTAALPVDTSGRSSRD